jgi:hypothetical protein
MAERFDGRVQAWEPWNEANIEGFGGHTTDEMCALQKAAYLGFKAVDPGLHVSMNVLAGAGDATHTDLVLGNETWPYFDSYNVHSYSAPSAYLSELAPARRAACGRPLWMTECGVHLPADETSWSSDTTRSDEKVQAEFVAKSYAGSLFAGVSRHFFFILGSYLERSRQFGILRADHTPRPAYSALAAVGRFLNGAVCLGRVQSGDATIVAFRAYPVDGTARPVLVAWAESSSTVPELEELSVQGVFDAYGRPLEGAVPSTVSPSPRFLVLAPGAEIPLALESPPALAPEPARLAPSPVVLQAELPRSCSSADLHGYLLPPGKVSRFPVHVYNFSDVPAEGSLRMEELPDNLSARLTPAAIRVPAGERITTWLELQLPAVGRRLVLGQTLRIRAELGRLGQPVLALRISADPALVEPSETWGLPQADSPEAWGPNTIHDAHMTCERTADRGVLFDIQFGEADPWAYPILEIPAGSVPTEADGLALQLELLEGDGVFRVQFYESNGAAYLTEIPYNASEGGVQPTVALFSGCSWGAHSAPDTNGRLDAGDIVRLMVGINATPRSRVRFVVRNLSWVRF